MKTCPLVFDLIIVIVGISSYLSSRSESDSSITPACLSILSFMPHSIIVRFLMRLSRVSITTLGLLLLLLDHDDERTSPFLSCFLMYQTARERKRERKGKQTFLLYDPLFVFFLSFDHAVLRALLTREHFKMEPLKVVQKKMFVLFLSIHTFHG